MSAKVDPIKDPVGAAHEVVLTLISSGMFFKDVPVKNSISDAAKVAKAITRIHQDIASYYRSCSE